MINFIELENVDVLSALIQTGSTEFLTFQFALARSQMSIPFSMYPKTLAVTLFVSSITCVTSTQAIPDGVVRSLGALSSLDASNQTILKVKHRHGNT